MVEFRELVGCNVGAWALELGVAIKTKNCIMSHLKNFKLIHQLIVYISLMCQNATTDSIFKYGQMLKKMNNTTSKKTVKLVMYIYHFIYKSKHVGRYFNLYGVKWY